MEYVDIEGLTLTGDGEKYATALALRGSRINRDEILRTLTTTPRLNDNTIGYKEIFTGPAGKHFFSIFPPTVLVHVVPDGYDYKYRTDNVDEWSYYAAGCNEREVKELLARDGPPSKTHRLRGRYDDSLRWRERLLAVRSSGVVSDRPTTVNSSFHIITERQEQLEYLNNINEDIVLDLEWTIDKRELISIQITELAHLSDTRSCGAYLPTFAYTRVGSDLYTYNSKSYGLALSSVFKRSTRDGYKIVLHNAKADINQFYEGDPLDLFGLNIHDTILMAYVAGEHELGLKELTKNLLKRPVMSLPNKLENQPIEVAAHYGMADVENTRDLYWLLKNKLEDTGQWDVYDKIERPLVPMIASMEKYGSPLDTIELQRLHDEFALEEEQIVESVQLEDGLDISDDKQQHDYLIKHIGYDTGTLDKRVLSRIPGEPVSRLLHYRSVRTLRRNFLAKHLSTASTIDGDYYAYPTFNQAGRDTDSGWRNAPATGRLSSANPNFQNQPRGIRGCFIAPRGFSLVSLDYSALELRVAASVSGDETMLSILNSGGDLHNFMRDRILEETGIEVTRTTAKNANFNLRYGGQADMLMTITAKERAFLDYETAEAIVQVDRNTYTGYWKWYEGVVDSARRTGYSETLWRRRRHNADLQSRDSTRRAHAERAATNMVVQGTAADIVKLAMAKLCYAHRYYGAHLAITVHDELVFWVPEANASKFLQAAKGIMESIQIPNTKLLVEGKAGRAWADAH